MFDVELLLNRLSRRRPIFHSEADFQHDFAWEARLMWPDTRVRLEQPFPGRTSGAIDVVIYRENRLHAVELKYFKGLHQSEREGEPFHLKSHGAQDIGRYHVCRDIGRMEAFCAQPQSSASVIVLTNDKYYWGGKTRPGTIAEAFDISGRRKLTGELRWAEHTAGTKRGKEAPIVLNHSYKPEWKDYSVFEAKNGTFRYIHLQVGASQIQD